MIRAGIYARISSDRDGDQLGVRRQVQDCEERAVRERWEVVERYVDDDVSAYSGRARPAYQRMLSDLREGYLDAVVVWHVDRLVRQPRELEDFLAVCDAAGVSRLASVSGDLDLSTHDGQLMARILGAFAKKESDDKSRRIRRKHQELAQAGKVGGGGTRPYGYADDRRTVVDSEAAVIREVAERVLAGEAIRAVCRDLDDRRITTVTGKRWRPQTLTRMLVSGRISGQRDHHGEIVATAEWPAIITPEQTARLRTLLRDPNRLTRRTVARRYPLVGLLRCGRCGATMVSRPRSGGDRRYICATGPGFVGCGHTYALSEPLESFLADAVLYRLDTPELAAALAGAAADPDAEQLQIAVAEAQEQLNALAAMFGRKEITLQEWSAAREPIEVRLKASKRDLGRLNRTSVLDGYVGNSAELRESWQTLPLHRQRAIIAAVLDHVVVGPGRRGFNRFDSTRFSPVWRV